MPSDLSIWLIAVPNDGDAEGLFPTLQTKLESSRALPRSNIAELAIPTLKAGTLDDLLTLSEELPKMDTFFTNAVAKVVETLRNLTNNDPVRLEQHTLVNERPCDDYLLRGWRWNAGKYGVNRSLKDIIEALNKEMTSIDNVMKSKLNSYNLAKGQLVQLQRKRTGNLSVRSLNDIIKKDDFVTDSEYLETLLVAVPKTQSREWEQKYERLTAMVVPRSSKKLSADDDFTLYSVTVFKRVHDEFAQKLRENKYILRDFSFDEEALQKQQQELASIEISEKELWQELLTLSRTNFSEAFQAFVHLKVVRLFVESILRYGPPAEFTGVVILPDAKSTKRLLTNLQSQFSYLAPRSKGSKDSKSGGGSSGDTAEIGGEYAALMEEEFFDFVLMEVPRVVS
ncbi:Vacuolar ATP synthase subunit C [Serendipita sp. 411]|nr:Vacuolar ATP synthase subunit C [Serendipita sp. 401]KAG8838058.1 Vacuolar ATP synthase subunit C [Serendipita sp. 400]KAG8851727.1 Vacuolar ATP synthase subunit C [Serendipita sp. 411]KAG9057113.1 Vacuolar ATP synthase subunit C [Serendipita sp. 407]